MDRAGYIELDTQVLGIYVGLLGYPVAGFRWSTQFAPSHWARKKHRQPSGPWLVPAEGPGATGSPSYMEQRYPVFTDRRSMELHRQFVRLGRLRPWALQPAILNFANRYGWLTSPSERWWLEPRNTPTYSNLDCPRGEHLTIWRDAIYEAASLAALWDLLRYKRRDELSKYVVASGSPQRVGVYAAWHAGRLSTSQDFGGLDWRPVTYGGEPEPVAEEGMGLGDGRFLSFPEIAGQRPDPATVTRLHLYDKISEKLHGQASPVLASGRPAGEALLLRPHSLLAAIYLHFARELSGRRAPIVPCGNPNCDGTIDPRHGRRYCNRWCQDQARYYRDPEKRRKPRGGTRNLDDNLDDNSG